MIGLAATAFYGMSSFDESSTVSSIESLENGELRLTILKSPFVSYTITTNIKNVQSVCALGDDDMGADDCEGNIIHVSKYTDAEGNHHEQGVFTLPADAFRDKQFLEWILAPKHEDETTVDDFSDLMKQKFTQRVSLGKFNLLGALNAKATGLANVNLDKDLDVSIEAN